MDIGFLGNAPRNLVICVPTLGQFDPANLALAIGSKPKKRPEFPFG